MSGAGYPGGRRVTDARPVVRSAEMDELQTAWDIHAKSKSAVSFSFYWFWM